MTTFNRKTTLMAGSMALALVALAAGCASSRAPILGIEDGSAGLIPLVTSVTPVDLATAVPVSTTALTAVFNEPINPASGTFTLTAAGQTPTGTLAFDASDQTATFTLTAGTTLAALTSYTATVTGANSLSTGLPMAAPFAWTFTTGNVVTTRPSVTLTAPVTSNPGPTVAGNTAIIAVFSQDMAPASINGASFTVTGSTGINPAGSVTYVVGSRTAVFTPQAALVTGTTYTATITTAATSLAGSALAGNQGTLPAASNYVWKFTAAAPGAVAPLVVLSTNPSANAINVSPSASVNATFTVPSLQRLNPATVNATTFTLTGPSPSLNSIQAASVVLDSATGKVATFTPLVALTTGATYTATIKGGAAGVMDLALPGNDMTNDFSWNFTVGAQTLPPSVNLGSAATFGDFGGTSGTTNTGLKTVINGDIGSTSVSTKVTGFHDSGVGDTYTETPLNSGLVNGKIFTAAPPPTAASTDEGNANTAAIALKASLDATTAFNTLAGMPSTGTAAANLGGLTLAAGVYKAPSGSFMIQGSNLTLDAKGDANAVFVFQMATTLTVGGPGAAFPQSVILINGAQAKNVFWQVGSAATINAAGGGNMVGTIIASAGVAISTYGNTILVTLDGRAISLIGSVTLVDTIVNVPAN